MRLTTQPALAVHRLLTIALAAVAAILSAARADGGVITAFDWHSGVASVAGEPVVVPDELNWNQNFVGLSPNPIIITQKAYHAIGPVDLTFAVVNTGGITEYAVHEGVANVTGIEWSGYRLELGFGIGDDFVAATSGDLTFDAPDFDSFFNFPFFPDVSVSAYEVVASGATLPAFAFMGGIVFHINVPDGITEFTIRQGPIPIPAPFSAAALLLGLGWSSRRRS